LKQRRIEREIRKLKRKIKREAKKRKGKILTGKDLIWEDKREL